MIDVNKVAASMPATRPPAECRSWVNFGSRTAPGSGPLIPQQQTCCDRFGMSVSCPDSDIGGELLYRRGSGRQRNGLSASGKKLRPFHKVPRERDIDTILMWVIEPSIPIKMCFRRTPPFVVMRPRRYLSLTCWTPKYGPSSGEAEAEV